MQHESRDRNSCRRAQLAAPDTVDGAVSGVVVFFVAAYGTVGDDICRKACDTTHSIKYWDKIVHSH